MSCFMFYGTVTTKGVKNMEVKIIAIPFTDPHFPADKAREEFSLLFGFRYLNLKKSSKKWTEWALYQYQLKLAV